jgi:hypothetical protein
MEDTIERGIEEREEDYDGYDDGSCYACGGSGWIITCCDDMCRGADECIHSDGETACRVCNSDGRKDPC